MANLRRPTREFSFSNHQRLQPNAAPPGNELDGMLHDLREAILSTQEALAELRRDDGQLRNNLVGPDQLRSDLRSTLIGDIAKVTDALTNQVRNAIASQTITIHDVNLLAKDAEAAANAASQWLAQVKQIESRLLQATTQTEITSQAITTTVTDTENWANYAHAQADNAARSEDNALAWAEYLAGPVVSGPEAPAFISQSAWPHGLFYQPVQGFGGLGGLWSAKWWAIMAQQLVGWISTFYLGAWDHHPAPGEVNPDTGQMVPNPIPPGSLYFNTTNNKLYVWTGDTWVSPFSLTGGVTSRFAYQATAGQTVFSGPDLFGNVPETEDDTEHDVHVNGVKLTRDYGTGEGDYEVDNTAAELTLLFPVTTDSIVQWDILVSADDLRPGAAVIFKIDPIPVDGVTTTFTLTYMSGTLSPWITKPVELLVFVDGVAQEPYVDFTAEEDTITFFAAPGATSRVWMEYFRSGNIVELELAPPPAPVIILSDNRVLETAPVNTTIGTLSLLHPFTGTPVYALADDAGGLFKIVGNSVQTNGALDFETAVSHNIVIVVSGITPAAPPRVVTIVVQDVAEPGTAGDLALVGSSVAEDAVIGMTIGNLSVLFATGTPTFTLLNNAGGRFFVSGNSLRVAAALGTPGTYLILVAVTGVTPAAPNEAFVITVTPAIGAGSINLTGSTIPEGSPIGTTVGTLSVSGASGTPIYTLVENPGGRFAVNSGNLLQVAGVLDFETTPLITITVAVGGVSPPAPSKEFSITVTFVDTTAPNITSTNTVTNAENSVLAHALTANEPVTWAIVGGLDVTRFEISGSTLRWLSNGVKDYETPNDSDANNQYVVQVRATDLAGNPSTSQTITVTVTDIAENVDRVRLDQQYVEVVSGGAGRVRLDQQYADVIHGGVNNRTRLDQQYTEVIHSGGANKVRLVQQYVEIISN